MWPWPGAAAWSSQRTTGLLPPSQSKATAWWHLHKTSHSPPCPSVNKETFLQAPQRPSLLKHLAPEFHPHVWFHGGRRSPGRAQAAEPWAFQGRWLAPPESQGGVTYFLLTHRLLAGTHAAGDVVFCVSRVFPQLRSSRGLT